MSSASPLRPSPTRFSSSGSSSAGWVKDELHLEFLVSLFYLLIESRFQTNSHRLQLVLLFLLGGLQPSLLLDFVLGAPLRFLLSLLRLQLILHQLGLFVVLHPDQAAQVLPQLQHLR